MNQTCSAVAALWIGMSSFAATAEVTFENPRNRLVLNQDATWRSWLDKGDERELLPDGAKVPAASVRIDGKTFLASHASQDGQTLAIGFSGTDTVLLYRVECEPDWIVFRLASIRGARPDRLTLLQLPVRVDANLGRRLNAAWDDRTAACLMAAHLRTDCRPRAGKFTVLEATTQDAPGPRLEDAAAAVIVCPTGDFKAIARAASHAFALPTNEDQQGTPVKDTALARGSYWFLSLAESEADQMIALCQRTGIRQVMLSSSAWCVSPGHYLFHQGRYPRGRESLKTLVARLREHGILTGMHCFASKISKQDPYVTPVPDERLLRGISASWRASDGILKTTLAAAITDDQSEIRMTSDLRHWPGSSAVADRYWEGGVEKHREVLIGNELVRYERVGPEGRWDTLLGCQRGAWGTSASAHAAGAAAAHLAVDGCINGFLIDQETDLMDEVAERLASIFDECGFEMIYFDGGEDVDRRRFHYYASNFQAQVMQRITRRPVLHMGTIPTHSLWHSFARSSTVDHYLNTLTGAIVGGRAPTSWPTVKEHIDRSVQYMLSVRQDMMPGELGWFGIWPAGKRVYAVSITPEQYDPYRRLGCEPGPAVLPSRENTIMTGELVSASQLRITVEYDGLQLDEIEYLMGKSLGYGVPVSLQTSFAQMDAHPLTPAILDLVRQYESLRVGGAVDPQVLQSLRQPGRDLAMLRRGDGLDFVPVERLLHEGADRQLRLFLGAVDGGSVAVLWHARRDGHLLVPLASERLTLSDFEGRSVPISIEQGMAVVPVGPVRRTLIARDVEATELRTALAAAEFRARRPEQLFLQADDFVRLTGEMAIGSKVGIEDPDAFGDVLVVTGRPAVSPVRDWYAEYTVEIPRAGLWSIWGRVRYPSGGDQSFGFVVPGETVTLAYGDAQILGNCGVGIERWHWTGRGAGSTTVPPGQPLTRKLPAGPFTFRVYAREGPGVTAKNPRLDLICLTEEPQPPTDEEARRALQRQDR